MSYIVDRISLITRGVAERLQYGLKETTGETDKEVLFIVDGVGGFQFGLSAARKVFRDEQIPIGTVFYKWQFGLVGEIWTDLMWYKRNRKMAEKLAHKITDFHHEHPETIIHLWSISGGAGIAIFACELLEQQIIDTLILACPAMSPQYNLAPAMRNANRCYALTSSNDYCILGVGTRIFGTTDRRFTRAAGMVGFQLPEDLSDEDINVYERFREIRWEPSWQKEGHHGGHLTWVTDHFIRGHLVPILRGEPHFEVHKIKKSVGSSADNRSEALSTKSI